MFYLRKFIFRELKQFTLLRGVLIRIYTTFHKAYIHHDDYTNINRTKNTKYKNNDRY